MKALYLNEPFKLELADIEMPKIKAPNDVLVKVMMAGICGSDMHNYLGETSGIAYPLIAGHEMAAEVVETGAEASDLAIGDHVIMDTVLSCGHCYPCSIGRNNVCENIKSRGSHYDGCMQEYMVLKRGTVHKINSGISWEKVALVEPLSIAGQCTARASVTAGDTVYIAGAGPIGLCILMICKLLGANVIISDIISSRLDLASKLGADYTINLKENDLVDAVKTLPGVRGVTVAIDAVGIPQVFEKLPRLVLPTARIVSLGFSAAPLSLSMVDITKKEITIVGSRMSINQFGRIIKLVEENRIDATPLITGIFDFKDSLNVFEELRNNKTVHCKVLLRIMEQTK